jgi:hypothetical protein
MIGSTRKPTFAPTQPPVPRTGAARPLAREHERHRGRQLDLQGAGAERRRPCPRGTSGSNPVSSTNRGVLNTAVRRGGRGFSPQAKVMAVAVVKKTIAPHQAFFTVTPLFTVAGERLRRPFFLGDVE